MLNLLKSIVTDFSEKIKGNLTEKEIKGIIEEKEEELLYLDFDLSLIEEIKRILREKLKGIKKENAKEVFVDVFLSFLEEESYFPKDEDVLLFLGLNGHGKTTAVARIAKFYEKAGKEVLVVGGDTFRAGAIEQLKVLSEKYGFPVFLPKYGEKPKVVLKKALSTFEKKLFLVDTAGRQTTNLALLEELKPLNELSTRNYLVVDSSSGRSILEDILIFDKYVGVDSLVFTRLDISPKGGMMFNLSFLLRKPIAFLSFGEEEEKLEKFNKEEFKRWLLYE